MRLKLDENLPFSLCKGLEILGHDVDTVPQENLKGYVCLTDGVFRCDGSFFEMNSHHQTLFITQLNKAAVIFN